MNSTIERLDSGKWCLNVFNGEAWVQHIFDNIETLLKYKAKATEERIDVC